MELTKHHIGYLLTIGGHAVRLSLSDLRELTMLATDAISEAEMQAVDAPIYRQIQNIKPNDNLVISSRLYGYQSINGICSMIRRRKKIGVYTTRLKHTGEIVVYRKD